MAARRRAVLKFQEWMAFVRAAGWHPSTWPKLADLWWQYHDDEGNLI